MARWSAADSPDVTDVRRLLRSDGVSLVVPNPGGGKSMHLTVGLRTRRDPELPERSFWDHAVQVRDVAGPGATEFQWFDGDFKSESRANQNSGIGTKLAAGAVFGFDPENTSWAPAAKGFVNASVQGSADTAIVQNANRSAVVSLRGTGQWAAFQIPHRLTLLVENAEAASVDVVTDVRIPVEMTLPANQAPAPITTHSYRPDLNPNPAVAMEVFTDMSMAVESVDLGALNRDTRKKLETKTLSVGTDRWKRFSPDSAAARLLDGLLSEDNVIRGSRNLGSGLNSQPLILDDGRTLQFTLRAALRPGQSYELQDMPGVHTIEATEKVQHAVVRSRGETTESTVGAEGGFGMGLKRRGEAIGRSIGPEAGGVTFDFALSGSGTSVVGNRRTDVAVTYEKSKIIPTGPTTRATFQVALTLTVTIDDTPHVVNGNGEVSSRILQSARSRLIGYLDPGASLPTVLRNPPAPEIDPDSPAGTRAAARAREEYLQNLEDHDALLFRFRENNHDHALSTAPRALIEGVGLGGAHIDEMSGVSELTAKAEVEAEKAAYRALIAHITPQTQAQAQAQAARPPHPMVANDQTLPPEPSARLSSPFAANAFARLAPQLRLALEEALSPMGLRAHQKSLIQTGVSIQPVTVRLPDGYDLTVRVRVNATTDGTTLRTVRGLASVVMEYGSETWLPTLAASSRGRTVSGALTIPVSGAFRTARIEGAQMPITTSVAGQGQISRGANVTVVHGPWMATDPHLKYEGETRAYVVGVEYQISIEAEITGERPSSVGFVTQGHWRVQTPITEAIPDHSLESADHSLEPADHTIEFTDHSLESAESADYSLEPAVHSLEPADHSLEPADHSLEPPAGDQGRDRDRSSGAPLQPTERVVELRGAKELMAGVTDLLNRTREVLLEEVNEDPIGPWRQLVGMEQKPPAVQVDLRALGGQLDPEPLRIRHLVNGGTRVQVSDAKGRVLGVVTVRSSLEQDHNPWPRRRVTMGLNDEAQVWQQHEVTRSTTWSWSLAGTLAAVATPGAPGAPEARAGTDRSWRRSWTSSSIRQDLMLDREGWRMEYAPRSMTKETRALRHTLSFTPSDYGRWHGLQATPSDAPSEVYIAHAVDVLVPDSDHPVQHLTGVQNPTPPHAVTNPGLVRRVMAGVPLSVATQPRTDSVAAAATDPAPTSEVEADSAAASEIEPALPISEPARAGEIEPAPSASDSAPAEQIEPAPPASDQQVAAANRSSATQVTDAVTRLLKRSAPRFLDAGALDPHLQESLSDAFAGGLTTAGRVRLPLIPTRGFGIRHLGTLEITVRPDGDPVPVHDQHGEPVILAATDAAFHQHRLRIGKRVDKDASGVGWTSTSRVRMAGIGPTPIGTVSVQGEHARNRRDVATRSSEAAPVMGVWSAATLDGPMHVYDQPLRVEVRLVKSTGVTPLAWPVWALYRLGVWIAHAAGFGRGTAWEAVDQDGNVRELTRRDRSRAEFGRVERGRVAVAETTQRVAVPDAIYRAADDLGEATVRDARNDRAPAGAAEPARRPTPDSVQHGEFVLQSFDPTAAADLQDELLTQLEEDPTHGHLFRNNGPALDSAHALLSKVHLTSRLDTTILGETYGGVLDRNGATLEQVRLDVGATIHDRPTSLGWAPSTLVRLPIPVGTSTIDMTENYNRDRTTTVTGALSILPKFVPKLNATLAPELIPSVTTTSGRGTGHATAIDNGNIGLHIITGPAMLVAADLLTTVTVSTSSGDATLPRPALGTIPENAPVLADPGHAPQAAAIASQAAVFAVTPAVARQLGVVHVSGEATRSGWHGPPRPLDTGPDAGTPTPSTLTTAEEKDLAEAAQLLPSFHGVTVVSGQATTDGSLLRWGQSVDARTILDGIPSQGIAVDRPFALVASNAANTANELAREAGRPVVATDGVITFVSNGDIRSTRNWFVANPNGDSLPLDNTDLDDALQAARPHLTRNDPRPVASFGRREVDPGVGRYGPVGPVTWPDAVPPLRYVELPAGVDLDDAEQAPDTPPGSGGLQAHSMDSDLTSAPGTSSPDGPDRDTETRITNNPLFWPRPRTNGVQANDIGSALTSTPASGHPDTTDDASPLPGPDDFEIDIDPTLTSTPASGHPDTTADASPLPGPDDFDIDIDPTHSSLAVGSAQSESDESESADADPAPEVDPDPSESYRVPYIDGSTPAPSETDETELTESEPDDPKPSGFDADLSDGLSTAASYRDPNSPPSTAESDRSENYPGPYLDGSTPAPSETDETTTPAETTATHIASGSESGSDNGWGPGHMWVLPAEVDEDSPITTESVAEIPSGLFFRTGSSDSDPLGPRQVDPAAPGTSARPTTADEQLAAARNVNVIPGVLTVVAHGNTNGQLVVDGRSRTAREVAQAITDSDAWRAKPWQPVRLLACRTGRGGHSSAAAELSSELGVPVTAPTDDVWTAPHLAGGVMVTSTDPTGRPRLPATGEMLTFRTDPSPPHATTAQSANGIDAPPAATYRPGTTSASQVLTRWLANDAPRHGRQDNPRGERLGATALAPSGARPPQPRRGAPPIAGTIPISAFDGIGTTRTPDLGVTNLPAHLRPDVSPPPSASTSLGPGMLTGLSSDSPGHRLRAGDAGTGAAGLGAAVADVVLHTLIPRGVLDEGGRADLRSAFEAKLGAALGTAYRIQDGGITVAAPGSSTDTISVSISPRTGGFRLLTPHEAGDTQHGVDRVFAIVGETTGSTAVMTGRSWATIGGAGPQFRLPVRTTGLGVQFQLGMRGSHKAGFAQNLTNEFQYVASSSGWTHFLVPRTLKIAMRRGDVVLESREALVLAAVAYPRAALLTKAPESSTAPSRAVSEPQLAPVPRRGHAVPSSMSDPWSPTAPVLTGRSATAPVLTGLTERPAAPRATTSSSTDKTSRVGWSPLMLSPNERHSVGGLFSVPESMDMAAVRTAVLDEIAARFFPGNRVARSDFDNPGDPVGGAIRDLLSESTLMPLLPQCTSAGISAHGLRVTASGGRSYDLQFLVSVVPGEVEDIDTAEASMAVKGEHYSRVFSFENNADGWRSGASVIASGPLPGTTPEPTFGKERTVRGAAGGALELSRTMDTTRMDCAVARRAVTYTAATTRLTMDARVEVLITWRRTPGVRNLTGTRPPSRETAESGQYVVNEQSTMLVRVRSADADLYARAAAGHDAHDLAPRHHRVTDQPAGGRRELPRGIRAGDGLDSAAIEHLGGVDGVFPAILAALGDRASNSTDREMLAGWFGTLPLLGLASSLFGPGIPVSWATPDAHGENQNTVTVRAVLGEQTAAGRVTGASVDLAMEQRTSSSVNRRLGRLRQRGVEVNFVGGVRERKMSTGPGLGGAAYAHGLQAVETTDMRSANHSVSYAGPVRTFDHTVSFEIEISTVHYPYEPAPPAGPALLGRLAGAVRWLAPPTFGRGVRIAEANPKPVSGWVRFAVPEPFAPRATTPDGPQPEAAPTAPPTAPAGEPQNVPLEPDDIVLFVGGSGRLGSAVEDALRQAGVDVTDGAVRSWLSSVTSPEQLLANVQDLIVGQDIDFPGLSIFGPRPVSVRIALTALPSVTPNHAVGESARYTVSLGTDAWTRVVGRNVHTSGSTGVISGGAGFIPHRIETAPEPATEPAPAPEPAADPPPPDGTPESRYRANTAAWGSGGHTSEASTSTSVHVVAGDRDKTGRSIVGTVYALDASWNVSVSVPPGSQWGLPGVFSGSPTTTATVSAPASITLLRPDTPVPGHPADADTDSSITASTADPGLDAAPSADRMSALGVPVVLRPTDPRQPTVADEVLRLVTANAPALLVRDGSEHGHLPSRLASQLTADALRDHTKTMLANGVVLSAALPGWLVDTMVEIRLTATRAGTASFTSDGLERQAHKAYRRDREHLAGRTSTENRVTMGGGGVAEMPTGTGVVWLQGDASSSHETQSGVVNPARADWTFTHNGWSERYDSSLLITVDVAVRTAATRRTLALGWLLNAGAQSVSTIWAGTPRTTATVTMTETRTFPAGMTSQLPQPTRPDLTEVAVDEAGPGTGSEAHRAPAADRSSNPAPSAALTVADISDGSATLMGMAPEVSRWIHQVLSDLVNTSGLWSDSVRQDALARLVNPGTLLAEVERVLSPSGFALDGLVEYRDHAGHTWVPVISAQVTPTTDIGWLAGTVEVLHGAPVAVDENASHSRGPIVSLGLGSGARLPGTSPPPGTAGPPMLGSGMISGHVSTESTVASNHFGGRDEATRTSGWFLHTSGRLVTTVQLVQRGTGRTPRAFVRELTVDNAVEVMLTPAVATRTGLDTTTRSPVAESWFLPAWHDLNPGEKHPLLHRAARGHVTAVSVDGQGRFTFRKRLFDAGQLASELHRHLP
ncbi:MAG: hypothetical protein ACRCYX_01295, partial [Dermatophilaceae bacterium]